MVAPKLPSADARPDSDRYASAGNASNRGLIKATKPGTADCDSKSLNSVGTILTVRPSIVMEAPLQPER